SLPMGLDLDCEHTQAFRQWRAWPWCGPGPGRGRVAKRTKGLESIEHVVRRHRIAGPARPIAAAAVMVSQRVQVADARRAVAWLAAELLQGATCPPCVVSARVTGDLGIGLIRETAVGKLA